METIDKSQQKFQILIQSAVLLVFSVFFVFFILNGLSDPIVLFFYVFCLLSLIIYFILLFTCEVSTVSAILYPGTTLFLAFLFEVLLLAYGLQSGGEFFKRSIIYIVYLLPMLLFYFYKKHRLKETNTYHLLFAASILIVFILCILTTIPLTRTPELVFFSGGIVILASLIGYLSFRNRINPVQKFFALTVSILWLFLYFCVYGISVINLIIQ